MDKVLKNCSGWCWPVIIYSIVVSLNILSVLSTPNQLKNISGQNVNRVIVAMRLSVVGLLWGSLMYYLCTKCRFKSAWFVFFLPVILMIIGIILSISIFNTVVYENFEDSN